MLDRAAGRTFWGPVAGLKQISKTNKRRKQQQLICSLRVMVSCRIKGPSARQLPGHCVGNFIPAPDSDSTPASAGEGPATFRRS